MKQEKKKASGEITAAGAVAHPEHLTATAKMPSEKRSTVDHFSQSNKH